MAQFIKRFVQDLTQDIRVRQCGTIVFNKDNESNIISVDLYNGQEEYSGGGSVAGACICPDGSTVPLTGSISGKTASVTLTGDCFAFPGQIGIGIQVVSGTTKTTVLKAIYNVELFETDDMVDPGSRITASVGQLVADIEAATAEIPASDMASLMSGIAPTFSATTNYAAGAYVYYSGSLYRFTNAHAAGSWTGTDVTAVALANDVDDLKRAYDNAIIMDGVANIEPGTWTLTGGIAAGNGNNYTSPKLFRFSFKEIPYPFAFDMSDADYEYTIWTYSTQSQGSPVYSPSGKAYTQRKTLIYSTETAKYFRIGFRRVDQADMTTGASDTTSDEYKVKNSLRFWKATDDSLTLSNVPADAKAAGDAVTALSNAVGVQTSELSSRIDDIKAELPKTVIKNYTLSADYSGADYTVVSDKKPGDNGWVDDSTMITILIPDDGTVNRVTIFRNNSVYSCNSDGAIISTWSSESVADSSASYGRKPNGNRGDYIAFILTKTHIANDSYNSIITNTGTFYTPFIEKGQTVIFKNGLLVGDYTIKLPTFVLGNLYANGAAISSTTRSVAPWMYVKKGTVIDTSCTAVNLMIYGVSATEYIHVLTDAYIAAGRRYTFTNDTYAVIRYDVGSWNVEAAEPTLNTPDQAQYFIRYILPDEIAKNEWAGKTWYSYGTSITDIGVGDTAGNSGSVGKWPLCVDALSGMTRTNGAIGSGSIMPSSSSGGNVKTAILQCPFDVDLITLELGPNDNYWDYLGNVGDTGDDTFLGNLYQIYDYLTKNTRALVVFVGIGARNLTGSTSNIVPANGEFRTRYRTMLDAVKKLSDLFGIPVIDADANACNLNRRIKGVVMRDYIHYTYLGGEIYGRYVWSQLKNMHPYFKFAE